MVLFHDIVRDVPQESLGARITVKTSSEAAIDDDYCWSLMSAEVRSIWDKYKMPPQPLYRRILAFITSYDIGFKVVLLVRQILRM